MVIAKRHRINCHAVLGVARVLLR